MKELIHRRGVWRATQPCARLKRRADMVGEDRAAAPGKVWLRMRCSDLRRRSAGNSGRGPLTINGSRRHQMHRAQPDDRTGNATHGESALRLAALQRDLRPEPELCNKAAWQHDQQPDYTLNPLPTCPTNQDQLSYRAMILNMLGIAAGASSLRVKLPPV